MVLINSQGYFCAVQNYVENAELTKCSQSPKGKLAVAMHFSEIIKLIIIYFLEVRTAHPVFTHKVEHRTNFTGHHAQIPVQPTLRGFNKTYDG